MEKGSLLKTLSSPTGTLLASAGNFDLIVHMCRHKQIFFAYCLMLSTRGNNLASQQHICFTIRSHPKQGANCWVADPP